MAEMRQDRGDYMGKLKDREFWESASMNNFTFRQYYNRLTELSISMFEWVNVPETIDVRFLELALFGDGMAVFFKDEDIGYLALRTMIGGHLDVYNIPYFRTAYASNGYNRPLTPDDSVIIFNNALRKNSRLDVEMYSKRLYNLDRAIDVNANSQKTPVLIKCDEKQRLTLKNLYKQYDGNEPVIYADDGLNIGSLAVLKTDAPFVADKLYQLKTQLWNEAMTYLGISNINVQKKERMISDEVMRNMGGTIASRYSRLNARRQACEAINKMFGLNMDCQFREDYREADDEVMFTGQTEDETTTDMLVDLRTQ
jgi:hypothetical protein